MIRKHILLLFFTIFFLISCSKNSNLDKVTLRANFLVSGEHSPFFLGIEKGFFKDEGIELEVYPGEGSSVSVQMVGTGKDTFGLASSEIVIMARANRIPVKSIALINEKSPVSIFSLKEKNITKPTDLYGKKVGVILKGNIYQQYQAMLRKLKMNKSLIEEIPVSASIENLLNNNIDALVHQTHKGATTLRVKGYNINEIMLEDYGIHFNGLTIIANDDLLKKDPTLVRRFLKATNRAWIYSSKNKNEAINALIKYNKDLDFNISKAEFIRFMELTNKTNIEKIGLQKIQLSDWDNTNDVLFELNMIPNKIDSNSSFTNVFIEKI